MVIALLIYSTSLFELSVFKVPGHHRLLIVITVGHEMNAALGSRPHCHIEKI